MKIKSKLLLLISALVSAVLLSIALFVGLQWNINSLEKEQIYLKNLDEALHNELYELSSFFHEDMRFKFQLENYREALAVKQEAMSKIDEIKNLRRLGSVIENSLSSIEGLANLQEENLV